MSNITTKLRATIGALGILACASPVAAQNHPHRGQMRFAAQWVERGHGVVRQQARWPRAVRVSMVAPGWRGPYIVGYGWRAHRVPYVWRGYGYHRPFVRRGVAIRVVRPYYLHRRAWGRAAWRNRPI